jgi:anti-sigma regulatory factor (Ser/Thr protein kinase)
MRPDHVGPLESKHPVRAEGGPGAGLLPFELDIPATPDAPATARAAVSAWIGHQVTETMLIDLRLLVGELVANSVVHADVPRDSVVSVRVQLGADALHVEVGDCGRGGTIALRTPDLTNGGGFGLNVVDVVSRRWGVRRHAGTQVWAELAFPPAG